MSTGQLAPGRERELISAEEMGRTLWRLARELREHHPEEPAVLCGIVTRGAYLAARLLALLELQGALGWSAVTLDTGPYRDDGPRPQGGLAERFPLPPAGPGAVAERELVLVDDVLFHGRTARAALAALADLGRPRSVELLVLVDRGHRELPLRATYVGRNLPTAAGERVLVRLSECDGGDSVWLRHQGPSAP